MTEYLFTKYAEKQLRKLPLATQRRIIKKLKKAIETSTLLSTADTIKGEKEKAYRLRIGKYRLVFDVAKDTAVVLKVGHRKDIYRN